MDQLITVKEAARLLACSEAAVRKWVFQRRLPVVKVGRLTRLRQRDLEALIADGTRAATSHDGGSPGAPRLV